MCRARVAERPAARLAPLLREYPDITLEFDISYGFRNIVADRFDAGVRLGSTIDKDMIAVPIGPPLRMAVVASPACFAVHGKPKAPKELTAHCCINQRMPTSGGLYVWDFARRLWPMADCFAQDWSPPFDGHHLYHPTRRQPSPAFSLVVQALRHGVQGVQGRRTPAISPRPA